MKHNVEKPDSDQRDGKIQIQNTYIELFQGDITEQEINAIVNSANFNLLLNTVVSAVIRTKGGPYIQEV